jgi:hypothetical protein
MMVLRPISRKVLTCKRTTRLKTKKYVDDQGSNGRNKNAHRILAKISI